MSRSCFLRHASFVNHNVGVVYTRIPGIRASVPFLPSCFPIQSTFQSILLLQPLSRSHFRILHPCHNHQTLYQETITMPLFGRREPSPPPAPVSPERKTGFFSRRRSSSSDIHRASTSSHHTSTSSTKRHSSVLHRGSGDPSIHAATQSLRQAEAAEREADAALFRAKNAVREAREHVRRLEREAAEEARLAKIKQSEAKALGKKGRALGRKSSSMKLYLDNTNRLQGHDHI
jgi:hypothetical protein